jgi:hypothetical protein
MDEKILGKRQTPLYAPCHMMAMQVMNDLLAENHIGVRFETSKALSGPSVFTLIKTDDPYAQVYDTGTELGYYLRHKETGLYVYGYKDTEFVDDRRKASYYGMELDDKDENRPDAEIDVRFLLKWNVEECDMQFLKGVNPDDFEVVIVAEPEDGEG